MTDSGPTAGVYVVSGSVPNLSLTASILLPYFPLNNTVDYVTPIYPGVYHRTVNSTVPYFSQELSHEETR